MATRTAHSCAQRGATEALARDELDGAAREQAELHFERCEACRSLFRQQTGQRFPRIRNYTIVAELGHGGFGVVYKALHHSKERWEALKLLFGRTAQRTAYFENEVRLVAKLRHPNIATLYEANLHGLPLYYAMEFVQGQHLDDYFRSHEVSLEQRIELVKTVAAAVGYAHREGVIHRDLKPQNILIDPQGQPRIVDFGIAKRLVVEAGRHEPSDAVPHSPESVVGTYGYISPEQLSGQSVDSRADVYGLGALLFHVITGQPARFAPQVERLREVLHERQVSRAADLAAIIACCVRPVPEQRYPTCEALVADLDHYLAGRPILARDDTTAGYRAARVSALVLRNHPLPVQAVAVLLVAYLIVHIFWYQGAHWLSRGSGGGDAVLVAFLPSTLEALAAGQIGADLPGIDPSDSKSYRLLYGRLMEKLAEAAPTVVAWDYFFKDCRHEFDEGFLRGVRALKAPVVVGHQNPDLNAEPILCPQIRAAVHGWGNLFGTRPGDLEADVFIPLAVRRGPNPPAASLALAAAGTARHPDCDVEIHVVRDRLNLYYRKRKVAGGSRWPYPPDRVPIVQREVALAHPPELEAQDECYFGHFRIDPLPNWAKAPIPFERVLTASPGELRQWFNGRAVLVGQMLPPQDQHRLAGGQAVFGCQAQAVVLDDLLSGTQFCRLSRAELFPLVGAACVLAALLANLVPIRGARPIRVASLAVAAIFCLAVAAALVATQVAETSWSIRGAAAACGAVAAAAVALLINLLHQRQLHLAPGLIWAAESTGASTTVTYQRAQDPGEGGEHQ
jgi:predicted Ser/Thr protein kinase